MNPPPSPFVPPLEAAVRHSLAYLAALDRSPVGANADAATLRQCLDKPLLDRGIASEQVIDELVADVAGGLHGTGSGRFFPWVIGGSLPAALAADWLTSAWDQNAHCYATGPAAAVVEEITVHG